MASPRPPRPPDPHPDCRCLPFRSRATFIRIEMPAAPFETGQSCELAPGEPRRPIPRNGDSTVGRFDPAAPELKVLVSVAATSSQAIPRRKVMPDHEACMTACRRFLPRFSLQSRRIGD
jgi:hypothetical protein